MFIACIIILSLALSTLLVMSFYKVITSSPKGKKSSTEADTVKIEINSVQAIPKDPDDYEFDDEVIPESKDEPHPENNAEAKRYVDKHAECWPVGFEAKRFLCSKGFVKERIPYMSLLENTPEIIDDAKNIPYEDVVKAFWNKTVEIDVLIKNEHDNLHCPKGQHVMNRNYSHKICEICNVKSSAYDLIQQDERSCNYCFPYSGSPTALEARETQLRRLLWLGQKAGHIAAPVKKDSPMSFLWNRKNK